MITRFIKKIIMMSKCDVSVFIINLFLLIIITPQGWAEQKEEKFSFDGELRLRYEKMEAQPFHMQQGMTNPHRILRGLMQFSGRPTTFMAG